MALQAIFSQPVFCLVMAAVLYMVHNPFNCLACMISVALLVCWSWVLTLLMLSCHFDGAICFREACRMYQNTTALRYTSMHHCILHHAMEYWGSLTGPLEQNSLQISMCQSQQHVQAPTKKMTYNWGLTCVQSLNICGRLCRCLHRLL